jgi:hypothetical protein
MQALKTIWNLIFAMGFSLAVGLPTLVSTYMEFDPYEPNSFSMSDTNWMFLSIVSFFFSAFVTQAAMKQLQALGRGDRRAAACFSSHSSSVEVRVLVNIQKIIRFWYL